MVKTARPVTFYQPENYRPEESAAYLMRQILSLMVTKVDQELEPAGLTSAQWQPLLKLHLGHASTVAEVARECRLDTGATTRMLDRLEAKGLVTRERSSTDRRVVNLVLTDAGRAAAQQIPTALCKVQNAYLEGFTPQEWQQLKDLLRRVLANGQAMSGPEQEEQE